MGRARGAGSQLAGGLVVVKAVTFVAPVCLVANSEIELHVRIDVDWDETLDPRGFLLHSVAASSTL